MVITSHVPFPPVPIPAAFEPPVADKEPPSVDWMVIFESSKHSIPGLSSVSVVIAFVPVLTMVTELAETRTDDLHFMSMFWKTMVTLLSRIAIIFVLDEPVTKMVSWGRPWTPSHVSLPPDTVTEPTLMLHVIVEMKKMNGTVGIEASEKIEFVSEYHPR
jgi:hypothetical protein